MNSLHIDGISKQECFHYVGYRKQIDIYLSGYDKCRLIFQIWIRYFWVVRQSLNNFNGYQEQKEHLHQLSNIKGLYIIKYHTCSPALIATDCTIPQRIEAWRTFEQMASNHISENKKVQHIFISFDGSIKLYVEH